MTEIIEFDKLEKRGPFLSPFVPPASERRGVTLDWRPKYIVILSGDLYNTHCEEIIEWCDKHCKGIRDWHIVMPDYYWGFDNKDDVLHFRMVWG